MTDVMLDLETLSSAPDAMILSIGAVTFGVGGAESVFYRAIDLRTKRGRISPSTVAWWVRQSAAAYHVFNDPSAVDVNAALRDFSQWLGGLENVALWGNGADFDNVVLRSAFELEDLYAPWSYKQNRCYRTLKNLRPDIPFEQSGVAHNALDNARSQARHAEKILAALTLPREEPAQ